MRRLAKVTIGGVTRVVDLLRNPPTYPARGYGVSGYGTSPYGL